MGIRVAAGDGGGALALAGFAGGAARRRNEILDKQLRAEELQRARDDSRDDNLERDAIRADQASTLSKERYASMEGLENVRSGNQADYLADRNAFTAQQSQQKFLDEFDYSKIDDQTRNDVNSLTQKFNEAVESGEYDEVQIQELGQQLNDQIAGKLRRKPLIKPPSPTQEDVTNKVFDYKGIPMVLDKDGIPKALPGYKATESIDGKMDRDTFNKTYDKVFNSIKNPLGDKAPTPEEVLAEIENRNKAFEKYQGGGEQQSSGATPVIPGAGNLPQDQLDSYMQPGMDSLGAGQAQPGNEWELPGYEEPDKKKTSGTSTANKWKIN